MLFDTTHILYMVIAYLLTAAGLVACYFLLKKEEHKFLVLKISALVTVALHYSSLWVEFFSTGNAEVQSSMLLPIHPCNICMWLLLITAFCKKRDTVAFRILAEYVFWAGTLCGTLGIVLNENYGNTPSLADYEVLKGLLSHSTMVFGCIYLLVSGIVKIRVFNVISAVCGLLLFIVDGAIINGLYAAFGLDPVNSMYMLEVPFSNMPWLTNYVMGIAALVLVFGICALYEFLALPKEDRWYSKLKKKRSIRNERIIFQAV